MSIKAVAVGVAASVLAGILLMAQAPRRPVTDDQKRQAIGELAKALRARYATGDVAEAAARLIEKRLASGAYADFADAHEFAAALTRDLQAETKDKHLRIGIPDAAPPPPAGKAPSPEGAREARLRSLRQTNAGFLKVEILPGNVGYLDVRRFQPPDVAVDTLNAAMGFLANTDAVIVDVRYCRGGSAFMMPYFAGYFFSEATSLWDMVFRGDNSTERYWTQPWLAGKRLASQPMYILTSAYTFSGAEGFAYRFQVLERATIVGETTGGGANAGGVLTIAPFFAVWMPMGRPVDQKTRTNWEGTGVVPDIKTAAADALATAHLDALQRLKAKADGGADAEWLDWAIARVEAGRHPVTIGEAAMGRVAGTYGADRVWVEGGQLRYQRETRGVVLLTPVTPSLFAAQAEDPVRVEFIVGADGRATKLVVTADNWSQETLARTR